MPTAAFLLLLFKEVYFRFEIAILFNDNTIFQLSFVRLVKARWTNHTLPVFPGIGDVFEEHKVRFRVFRPGTPRAPYVYSFNWVWHVLFASPGNV